MKANLESDMTFIERSCKVSLPYNNLKLTMTHRDHVVIETLQEHRAQENVLLGEPAQVGLKQKFVPSKIAKLRDQPKEKTISFTKALYNTNACTVARFQ